MPGYKSLSRQFSGAAAEQVRFAEVLLRSGDPREAVHVLETTLELCALESPELPGWLCGRLASLYRTIGRYDDEVLLLERYRESQRNEDAHTRFDARLSKARAIADRKRRTETRALSSVRKVIHGHEDGEAPPSVAARQDDDGFSSAANTAVRRAILASAGSGDLTGLSSALRRMADEAIDHDYPPERMVLALKTLWNGTPLTAPAEPIDRHALYRELLTTALAHYFESSA